MLGCDQRVVRRPAVAQALDLLRDCGLLPLPHRGVRQGRLVETVDQQAAALALSRRNMKLRTDVVLQAARESQVAQQ